jgi:glycerophosphoryl diester phosphodiesterase
MATDILSGCGRRPETTRRPAGLDIQGHRGARGLLPENTIPAFLKAFELGVNTLELDVVITRDQQVLVSHEPFMSDEICLLPNGAVIPEGTGKLHNIFTLTYEQVRQYDCGSKPHPRFPEQQNLPAAKPLLTAVIAAVEEQRQQQNLAAVNYNVEIKSTSEGDGMYHPEPETFVRLVVAVLQEKGVLKRSNIQSFDLRPLQITRHLYPDLRLALLVENEEDAEKNLQQLGFTPEIYSPSFELVDESLAKFVRQKGMQLIPWTVNEVADIHRMLALGVDGIITDYPNRVLNLLR